MHLAGQSFPTVISKVYHFKPVVQTGWSHFKDSGDFLKKTGNAGNIPENFISVTAGVVRLYIYRIMLVLKLLIKYLMQGKNLLSLLTISLK